MIGSHCLIRSNTMLLSSACASRHNHFQLIRLVCALGVLLSHSQLVYSGKHIEWSIFGIRMDHFFVTIFFAVSGFLVCKSLLHRHDLKHYAIARSIRLLPALTVLLLMTVLVAGPLLTTVSLREYFFSELTWQYFLNINLFNIHTQFELTEVFTSAPYPNNINASLWTLPLEVWLYALLAVFYCLALMLQERFSKPLSAFLLMAGIAAIVGLSVLIVYTTQTRHDDSSTMLTFVCMFLTGAWLYIARGRITLRYRHALLLWGLTLVLQSTWLLPACLAFSVAYSILIISYVPKGPFMRFNKFGDYSYGIYIYGFLIQQSTLQLWPQASFVSFVSVSSLLTLFCASVSWHWLEKPCLDYLKTSYSFKGAHPI